MVCSCREPLVVDSFSAYLRILNKDATLNSGESLRFQVEVNRDTYRIVSVDCDSRMEGVFPTSGDVFSDSEVISVPVTVSQTHRGTLHVVVEDIYSSSRESLEATYTGRNIAEVSMKVLTPVVCSGDDFVVRLFCSHATVKIRAVECPFAFEGFAPYREYAVGAGGYVDLVAPKVSVTENGQKNVRLTVEDTESGVVRELTDVVELRKPTVVSMALVDYYGAALPFVYDGEDVYLRIYDTQEVFKVEDYYCEFGNTLSVGASYSVSSDGFFQLAYRKIRVESDHDGTVLLALYDPVHGETHRLSVDYKARVSR